MWRHGDRSPSSTYPADPHQKDAWPQGWKQLTQLGMRQCANLGALVRRRYAIENALVSTEYKRNEVFFTELYRLAAAAAAAAALCHKTRKSTKITDSAGN